MSYELRDQISKYIGFSPEEIRPPITDEDKQLFREIIADQEEMIDIVMNEYRFLPFFPRLSEKRYSPWKKVSDGSFFKFIQNPV